MGGLITVYRCISMEKKNVNINESVKEKRYFLLVKDLCVQIINIM